MQEEWLFHAYRNLLYSHMNVLTLHECHNLHAVVYTGFVPASYVIIKEEQVSKWVG